MIQYCLLKLFLAANNQCFTWPYKMKRYFAKEVVFIATIKRQSFKIITLWENGKSIFNHFPLVEAVLYQYTHSIH